MNWVVEMPEVFSRGVAYDAVLTVTDRATQMVHFIPTNAHETDEDTADLFLRNVVRLHGLPRSLIYDRDHRFTPYFWRTICERLDVKHLLTTAYHPQTNGQAERTNQTMKKLLRAAQFEGSSWFDVLPHGEVAMNSASLPDTKWTPLCVPRAF